MNTTAPPHILVVPGWYPSILEPFNGDFVKDQVALLRKEGWKIDTLFADLNIAYLRQLQFSTRASFYSDHSGNIDRFISGPTWPKNTDRGVKSWINKYVHFINLHVQEHPLPDVLHAHTYLGGIVAQAISKKHNIPYIITEHYTGWQSGTYSNSHFKIAKTVYQEANQVICVGQDLGTTISKLFKVSPKIIPNFIDFDLFKISDKTNNEPHTIIGIGDLIARKQWGHLIHAFKILLSQYPNTKLQLVGSGPTLSKLKQLSKKLNITNRIEFLGQLNKYDVARLIANSNLLVHTSKLETFGLVAIEALACGVPVITYNNGGSKEYQDCKGVEVVSLNDIGSLGEMMIKTFNQEKKNTIIKTEIRKDCMDRFSVQAVAQEMRSVLYGTTIQ